MISTAQPTRDFFRQLRPGQLLEALFDAVPSVHFFVKDRESRFMTCSRSFARLVGASSVSELIGKTDFDCSADFLAETFVADDRLVMESGKSIVRKLELVPSGDSLDWLMTTKVPLFDHAGSVVGLAGICQVIQETHAVYRDHPEMRRIIDFIRQRFREKITISDMADEVGISVSSVERLFRGTFGVTPLMYLRRTRLNAACRLLRSGREPLSDIAGQCGFNDQTGMTRAFRQELNITPLRYRRRYTNQNGTAREYHMEAVQ